MSEDVVTLHSSKVGHGGGDSGPPDLTNRGADAEIVVSFDRSIYGGAIPEYNPTLMGHNAIITYDKMRKNDAQVKASLRLVKSPILAAEIYIDPASDSPEHKEQAEFVEWNLIHMHRSFAEFFREALSCLDFGFYAFEKQWEVSKWRPIPTEDAPKPREREVFKILDLTPRHPAKIQDFKWTSEGFLAQIEYGYRFTPIDIDKCLLFSFESEADDPTGMSILRSAYKHWFYKDNLYRIDAIQKERHGIGIPQITLPLGASQTDIDNAREMAENLRTNEKAFILTPYGWEVKFAKPEGNLVNVLDSAQHHGLMILQNVLAQFLSLGTQESGSRAVGNTLSEAFNRSVKFVGEFMRGVINLQLIPQLVDFNFARPTGYPRLKIRYTGDEATWRSFSVALRNLVEPGVITPTPELETWVSEFLGMPNPSSFALNRGVDDRIRKPKPPREGSRTGNPVQ